MKPIIVSLLLFTAGCGAGYRSELRGNGVAAISATEVPTGGPSVAFASTGNRLRVNYRIALPRALQVNYQIACGDDQVAGVVGETAEAYRQRRLAELAAERQRTVQLAGAVGQAVLGSATATAGASAPGAEASASATVSGGAVTAAAADASLAEAQLPPGDVGARTIADVVTFQPSAAGSCRLRLWSETGDDLTGVTGDFSVAELVDVAAERRARKARAAAAAVELRGELRTSLVAHGADPLRREREQRAREAQRQRDEAIRRAEAERRDRSRRAAAERDRQRRWAEAERARVERQRRDQVRLSAELELRRQRDAERMRAMAAAQARLRLALDLRGQLGAWLVVRGADPDHYARVQAQARAAAEAEAELRARRRAIRARAEAEARAAAEAEAELRARQRAAADAAAQARRERAARVVSGVRLDLRGYLVARGAIDRPARPQPVAETPPPSPVVGAVWLGGEYQWSGGAWRWQAGHWRLPPDSVTVTVDGDRPAPAAAVSAPATGGYGVSVEVPVTAPVIDIQIGSRTTGPQPAPRPAPHDHRGEARRPADKRAHDHRGERPSESVPVTGGSR